MSAFTQRLRLQWLVKNGYTGPRTRHTGGMGAVAPMATLQPPAETLSAGNAVKHPRFFTRPEKQAVAVPYQSTARDLKSC
jgi:hypothetical protein